LNKTPVFILPGLGNSGADHWQSLWEASDAAWHLNAGSGLGDWPQGKKLLKKLLNEKGS